MSLGDDQVFPCGCGFDDASFPHDCNAEIKKKHHLLGMSVDETLSLQTRTINKLFALVDTLQQRCHALEMQVRCLHLFENKNTHMKCIHCGQERGF